LCWRLLRADPTCQFQEAHTAVRRVCSPAGEAAAALALADGCVLFPSGQVDLLLVPSGGGALTAPLVLRDAASCAQARSGEVALSVLSCEDPRRGSLVAGPLRALARGERSTKVRQSTLSGRNRRSLRVSGALSAVAAGDMLVATARRGSGSVQLWHVESGSLAGEVAAHEAGSTVLDMALLGAEAAVQAGELASQGGGLALHGGLLLTAASDGTAKLHALGGAAAGAPPRHAGAPSGEVGSAEMQPDLPPRSPAPACTEASAEVSAAAAAGGEAAAVGGGAVAGGEAAAAAAGGASHGEGQPPSGGGAARCVLCVAGHHGAVRRAELSGAWLLTGGEDARALLWAAHGGRKLLTLAGHRAPLCLTRVVAALLLTADIEGEVRVWDARRGACLRRHAPLPAHAPLADMRLAPDGLLALSAAGHATLVQFSPAPAPAPLAVEWEAPLVEASAAAASSAPPAAAPPAAATTAAQGDTEAAPPAAVAPFPTARVREHIQSYTPKVAEGAPEYMAAVLQYMTAEVLQRAGDAARGGVTGTITPHHIRQAVRADENLTKLVGEEALEQGGLLRPPVEAEAATEAGPSTGSAAEGGSSSGPFPTARVREHIQSYTPEVAEGAPEYMAAVLQYVTAEVLQRAGDAARGGVTGTITPHHIRQAVRADSELTELVGKEALEEGGLLRPTGTVDEAGAGGSKTGG